MCSGGGGSAPKVKAAPLAPSVVAPIEADTTARSAGDDERKKRRAASGRGDTILTGGMGVTSQAQLGGKKLLGE